LRTSPPLRPGAARGLLRDPERNRSDSARRLPQRVSEAARQRRRVEPRDECPGEPCHRLTRASSTPTRSGSSSWWPSAGVCTAGTLRANYRASRNGTAAIPHVDFPPRVSEAARQRRRFEPRDACRRGSATSQRARRKDPSGGSVTGRSIRQRPATRSSSRCSVAGGVLFVISARAASMVRLRVS
jgi:hypothetical protein